jgi:hypothetical protein
MLQGHFYHKTTRKIVAAFGTIFNSIVICKYDSNMVEVGRIKVPLSYAAKDRFIYALAYDSEQEKPIQVQLPRMSFELLSWNYDANRKLPSRNRIYTANTSNQNRVQSNLQPVPYDFQFDLSIYTRNIEDSHQILEQILPYFTPDYTVTVSLIDESGAEIKRDIPIIYNGSSSEVQYEGDSTSVRYVIHSLSFTVKAYLFGPTHDSAIIRKAITNIYDTVGDHYQVRVDMDAGGVGNYAVEEEVYSGNDWESAEWRARVMSWSNASNLLIVYDMHGDLPVDGDVVYGLDTGARWTVSTASRSFLKHAQTVIEPNPTSANVGDANISYTYTTTEFPTVDPTP